MVGTSAMKESIKEKIKLFRTYIDDKFSICIGSGNNLQLFMNKFNDVHQNKFNFNYSKTQTNILGNFQQRYIERKSTENPISIENRSTQKASNEASRFCKRCDCTTQKDLKNNLKYLQRD